MRFELRAAAAADLDAIVALDEKSFSQPWSRRSFEKSLADEMTLVLVALNANERTNSESANRVLGYGVAYVVASEAEIATLAVDEGARGQGLGDTILRALIAFCAARGATEIFLEVRVSNVAAQKLYARCGFVQTGLRRRYYADGEHAVLMQKTVGDA